MQHMGAECTFRPWQNVHSAVSLTETDDKMRAFAEQVFASETKDENVRDEISMFDVAEDCPILHHEMAHHLHYEDDAEKRWDTWLFIVSWCFF